MQQMMLCTLPGPAGELTVLPRPLARLRGPTSKGGRGREGKGRGRERMASS